MEIQKVKAKFERRIINWMYKMKVQTMNNSQRAMLSTVIVMALLILTWTLIPINFETNDDTGIMEYLSGARTGKPESDSIFSLFLWGKIVSTLYTINAGIPWYILIFLTLIALSLMAVCYCVISSVHNVWGIFFPLYFMCFLYYSVIIQFTMVSAYCGIGAISLMLINKNEERRKYIVVKNLIIFLFMFFAVNIRLKIGYLILANTAGIVCFEIFKYLLKASDKKKMKNIMVSFIVACVAVGISVSAHNIHESVTGWSDFREYHAQRANFTDYSKLDYEANKDLFDSIGWSEDFYGLVSGWFFMDENVNAETFRLINECNDHKPVDVDLDLLRIRYPRIGFQVIAWILLLIVFLIDKIKRHAGRYEESIISFLWLILWLTETLYFANSGRMQERAFEAWTLLALMPSFFEMLGSCLRVTREEKNMVRDVITFVSLFAICIICICYPNGVFAGAKALSAERNERKTLKVEVEDYVMEHPDNLYIYDRSLTMPGDPWIVYPEKKPYNLVFWGGSGYNSPLYYAQIERNGFEHIYGEDFFDEKISFMGKEEPHEDLIKVMDEKFPGCSCDVTDTGNGFIVYKFSR